MFKKAVRRGRSERGTEAYFFRYVEVPSDARTKPEAFFNIRQSKGATGFDGDQEVTSACRALGVSLNLRENATANQELALAA
jgi:hypothetical protein